MARAPRLSFSHLGIHVHDIERMTAFYTEFMGFFVTDRGTLAVLPGQPKIVFLSRDPNEHHQLALVEGREDGGGTARVVNQISFHLDSLEDLKALAIAAEAEGIEPRMPISHGNEWSLYFPDPEGNGIECFVHTPWYVPQPVVEPLDLSASNEEIRNQTEAAFSGRAGFKPYDQWRTEFAEKHGLEWEADRRR